MPSPTTCPRTSPSSSAVLVALLAVLVAAASYVVATPAVGSDGERTASPRAAGATITVTPQAYIAGEKLRIRGNIGRKGRRAVVLQRYMRDRYLDTARGRTDARGNFSFTVRGPGMATPFSVLAPGLGKRTGQAPVKPLDQDLTISYDPPVAVLGLPVRVTVRTFPVRPGRAVELRRRLNGSTWERVASAPSDDRGVARFTVRPPLLGRLAYRAVAGALPRQGVSEFPSFPTLLQVLLGGRGGRS